MLLPSIIIKSPPCILIIEPVLTVAEIVAVTPVAGLIVNVFVADAPGIATILIGNEFSKVLL